MRKGYCLPQSRFGHDRETLWVRNIHTDAGVFSIEVSRFGIYRLQFPSRYLFGNRRILKSPKEPKPVRECLKKIAAYLRRYFSQKPVNFSRLRIDLRGMTEFEKRVLQTLKTVRRGSMLSYGQLAQRAGYPGAARAVGSVMRKNRIPVILPCHRIVPADATIGRYSCGVHWKKRLLRIEGRLGVPQKTSKGSRVRS